MTDCEQLLKEHTPKRIYKYAPFDTDGYWKNNIYNGLVFLQKPLYFNDPFDCAINIDENVKNKYMKKDGINNLKQIYKQEPLISCFSELNDSIQMWSHYANKHSKKYILKPKRIY